MKVKFLEFLGLKDIETLSTDQKRAAQTLIREIRKHETIQLKQKHA